MMPMWTISTTETKSSIRKSAAPSTSINTFKKSNRISNEALLSKLLHLSAHGIGLRLWMDTALVVECIIEYGECYCGVVVVPVQSPEYTASCYSVHSVEGTLNCHKDVVGIEGGHLNEKGNESPQLDM
jgi:hypothetical protein